MKQLNQRGHLNGLLIPLILLAVLFLGAAGFGGWAYMSRQDYKKNSDEKVTAAVKVAEEKTSTKKDTEFVEKEKLPLRTYTGPSPFGSLTVQYPKTWSAYVGEKATSNTPVDAYFQPGFVPFVDSNSSYALRFQVIDSPYASVLKNYDSIIKGGKLTASAYIPTKVPTVTGTRLDGTVINNKQGSMVIVPLRDKTLKIWTESLDFVKDFNDNILPNYTFNQ